MRSPIGVSVPLLPVDLGSMLTDPLAAETSDALRTAIASAKTLADEGRYLEAIVRLNGQLMEHGSRADLLSAVADIEEDADRVEAAFAHMAKAVSLDPDNPQLIADWALMQLRAGLFREALATLADAPSEQANQPVLRSARAQVYRWAKLYALAADACGPRSVIWWLTAGPVPPLRALLRHLDNNVLATWRMWSEHLYALQLLSTEPIPLRSIQVRAEVDATNLAQARQEHWEDATRWVHARFGITLLVITTWGLLVTQFSQGGPPVGLVARILITGVGTLLAWLSLPLLRWLIYRGASVKYLVFWRRFLPIAFVLVGGGLWILTVGVGGREIHAIGLGLAAGPPLFLAYRGIDQTIMLVGVFWRARLRRIRPLATAIYMLLGVLWEMEQPTDPSQLQLRSFWMSLLEQAARSIERDLVTVLHGYDQHTREVTTQHFRAAARAIRILKQDIAMPTTGSWDRVEAELSHAFTALANGDLGDLRTAEEPSEERHPVSRWSRTIAAARTLLVAAAPLATVIALQPVLELAADHYHWAKIATAGWAAVYLLISIDPTLREKIEVVSDLVSLARGEHRPEQREQGRVRGELPHQGPR